MLKEMLETWDEEPVKNLDEEPRMKTPFRDELIK